MLSAHCQILIDRFYPAVGFFSLFVVASIGLFLPLPIALDLVVCAALLQAGIPVIYVATLLFVLGIYSVYPFFIVWASISKRVAVILASTLIPLGMLTGYVSQYYHDRDLQVLLNHEVEYARISMYL